jgi:glycosyltransferase involved in cell wall biosynthesis
MEMNASAEEKRNRRTLMYVGHIHAGKGVDFLLSAARLLAKKNVRILFYGGEPRQVPEYEFRAAAMGIAEHVAFIPFKAPVEMHRAMAREASLGMVMLKDTFYNHHLTCPVKALDYLSHGIPAVGSDIPSVHEVLGDAGTYVPPERLEGFVGAVIGLLDDSGRYETMVTQSILRSREISWPLRARILADSAAVKQPPGRLGTVS